MDQIGKAEHFKALHVAGQPLVLYNIWDAGGAKAVAEAGANAVATGSWSVAAAQGYADGEKIPMEFALQITTRIAQAVEIPLTIDFEGGYAREPETLAANVEQLLATGAIGLNIEDQIINGEGLYAVDEQVSRIKAIRQVADAAKVSLFINARTDLFLKAKGDQHEQLCTNAHERAAAYADAGADGFFVPGLTQPALIEQMCQKTQLPVNVMMRGELKSINDAAVLGVSRVSFGPAPYFSALATLQEAFKTIA